MSNVIPFRLAKNGEDKDIEGALHNVKNRTKRIKQLIRLGMEYEAIDKLEKNSFFTKRDGAPTDFVNKTFDFGDIQIKGVNVTKVNNTEIKNNLLAGFE